jgi:hypothetical protein
LCGGESLEGLLDCACLCGGRHDETRFHTLACRDERCELARKVRIALTQAGRIDQDQLAVIELIDEISQLLGAFHCIRRCTEQSTERVNLFLRADAHAIGRDQSELARTVAQHPTRRELRQQSRLADARWTYERNDSAGVEPSLIHHRYPT